MGNIQKKFRKTACKRHFYSPERREHTEKAIILEDFHPGKQYIEILHLVSESATKILLFPTSSCNYP
ncbi:MAG: hypothetical protein D3907_00585 [Candidatus Electrothrix sp. AUS3]|nr:hypothetical protein [Candidatus Electrothrix gigas]